MSSIHIHGIMSERIYPKAKPTEDAVALSLIDATTVDFSATSAIWFCEKPDKQQDGFDLFDHFRQSLRHTLDAYPHFTGQLKSIASLDSSESTAETANFEKHARRYGRVYAHYGTSSDPGVEFITAKSTATLDTLCPASRPTEQPIYNQQRVSVDGLIPSVRIANAVRPKPADVNGALLPLLAVQITQLACGGFSLSAKMAHPVADISSLVHFIKDWASIGRWILSGSAPPVPLLEPVLEPDLLDSMAAADINAEAPDPKTLKQAATLPLHRYDWWISTADCPWEAVVPEAYRTREIHPIGSPMPWSEWDTTSPVSHYVIHLTSKQVETIWKAAIKGSPHETGALRISRHDVILAHIWSCIARARNQHEDSDPIHCDLTLGLRPALHLGERFVGSPSMMVDIEMTGSEVASSKFPSTELIRTISQKIRKTINQMIRPAAIAAHLHSLAFETSPQRIWQAFLGSRHLLVTSWARAGVYDVNFGLNESPRIRFTEGVIADLDGCVLIKEAPPPYGVDGSGASWTDNGVDVSIHLRTEDMERLIEDPLLLPE
ncbi:transferase family protein [Penicillium verhagenii]|uniref:transferase family protein n=1 Tax=Penicillium verhagenii TaxID=1562060 RepID=UPI002545AF15|nr:transferase family protein [Penicillium verhagenii]KAJ5924066.1 transferase family protein [Penicillium verhagenii]